MSSKTKTEATTPGPWVVVDDELTLAVICDNWEKVEDLCRRTDIVTGGNCGVLVLSLPYAKAAPDLLEACKWLVSQCDGLPTIAISNCREQYAKALAAIAKALPDKDKGEA